jgi:hypothetical protein
LQVKKKRSKKREVEKMDCETIFEAEEISIRKILNLFGTEEEILKYFDFSQNSNRIITDFRCILFTFDFQKKILEIELTKRKQLLKEICARHRNWSYSDECDKLFMAVFY